MAESKDRDYIGDGVYVVYDGYGVELRANDPDQPSDTIYLEPYVLESLNRFYERMTENE